MGEAHGKSSKNSRKLNCFKSLQTFYTWCGCFGTGLGMLFQLCKGLDVPHELFKKIEKNSSKIAVFQLIRSKGAPHRLNTAIFELFFFDFLKEFVSDVQTFIEVKQHPQSGPETPHTMCEKIEDFLKNSIFD